MPRARNQGCLRCKARHLKCDEAIPACRACHKSSRACRYADPDAPQDLPVLQDRPRQLLLLKHWVDDTAKIMDPVDDTRTFACHVAKLAWTCQPILYAICALVLFHQQRLAGARDPDEEARDLYVAAAKGLAEILHTDIATALFCTTILRVYQELEGRDELQGSLHLAGAVALLHRNSMRLTATDAAVFAILRQDLSCALAHGKPLAFPWQKYPVLLHGRESDAGSADEMSLLLAHRLAAQTPAEMTAIDERIASWRIHLPESFTPVECWQSQYGRLVYLQPWHAIAMASYAAACLLRAPVTSDALLILRTALYSDHLGVQIHLGGMIPLCQLKLPQEHQPFLHKVVGVLDATCGYHACISPAD